MTSSKDNPLLAPPSPLRDRVLGAVRAEPSPVRDEVRSRNQVRWAVALAFVVVAQGMRGWVVLGDRPLGFSEWLLGGWLLVSLAASYLLLRRGKTMLGPPREVLVGTSIGSLVLIVALLAAGYMVWPDALSLETTLDHHAACMTMTLIIAAVPMAALVGSRRGCDPVHPACTAMSLAAAVGLWASLSTVLVCPMAGPVHMLFGHILPMALLLAFGAFVLQKLIALK